VLITTKIPDKALSLIRTSNFDVTMLKPEEPVSRSDLLKMMSDVEGLFCVLTDHVDKEFLESAKNLRAIATMSVGFDHIDLSLCTERGIKVGNTPNILTETTADLIIGLMLATARRIPEAINHVRGNTWPNAWIPEWMCGTDVNGSTVGIVGMGRIGTAVAKRLVGFNCNIIYSASKPEKSQYGKQVDFETLLKESDFVVPCVPLTPNTRLLFNKGTFRKMKKGAIFINASRGALVDQDALHEAISTGHLEACGLDVTTPEPIPKTHPLLSSELQNRVVIFPHIGSATTATREKMALMAAQNLIAALENNPMPHPLN